MLWVAVAASASAQEEERQDTINRSVVTASLRQILSRKSAYSTEVLQEKFLQRHFSGNVVQAMENLPGIQSMDIGSGFSKPMIRGMGFSRIAVSEGGIKQEGQQWGADHGLEIDAYSVTGIQVLKGPASLLYGSDAIGGVIEILPPEQPVTDGPYAEVKTLAKSVNDLLGGSVMVGYANDRWMLQTRYTEQHYGDYRVPADTIVYLTRRIPLYGRKMKNTAGYERDASLYASCRAGHYRGSYTLSNAFQKAGFFPGAHGIPDLKRLQDDGDSRNIDLPMSRVNHLKAATTQSFTAGRHTFTADLGYQLNHREEWSLFHTHYADQTPPDVDPDKDLAFTLHTVTANMKYKHTASARFNSTFGINAEAQHNTFSGYSFLLPEYRRQTAGAFWLGSWKPKASLSVIGGLRYDYGHISIDAHYDEYAGQYSAAATDRTFGDISGSAGLVWNPTADHLIKLNIGRSFRLPGANELSSNGVHHGTFRHEQGDPTLRSERGWQLDASIDLHWSRLEVELSPFFNRYSSYIYLNPTGEWSSLPHAGQIYRYCEAPAIFTGGELEIHLQLLKHLEYRFSGEYVYTFNETARTALTFSPPATMRNILTYKGKKWELSAEMQTIADQNRIAHNENPTSGATLLHLGATATVPLFGTPVDINLSVHNLFNKQYFNHLSFYRQVEIPEPGRNFTLSLRIPINKQ